MSVITLTSDFGVSSPYVAAMKASILSIAPSATIVDLTHAISPQNIAEGAFILQDFAWRFPSNSIHVAVVDPGVGSERGIIYLRAGNQQFIAPDNGLLSVVADSQPPEQIIEVTNQDYWIHPVSATFHGRDIMSPVAAHVLSGVAPTDLGRSVKSWTNLPISPIELQTSLIQCTVIRADSFGNLLTNATLEHLQSMDSDPTELVIETPNGALPVKLVRTYSDAKPGDFVVLIGSNGHLEVSVVNGNAARQLNWNSGQRLNLHVAR